VQAKLPLGASESIHPRVPTLHHCSFGISASDVFSKDASVFVSSRVVHYAYALSSPAFELI
jgi:hypothetical protein